MSLLQCARQGFALGLTVLVGAIHKIRVESFLKLVVGLLEVTSSMKGQVGDGGGFILYYFCFGSFLSLLGTTVFLVKLQEAKDSLLGRLFAYGALGRSGRLIHEWSMDKDTPYIKEFVSVLISLANKKRYLQEPAVSIILDLVEKVCISLGWK